MSRNWNNQGIRTESAPGTLSPEELQEIRQTYYTRQDEFDRLSNLYEDRQYTNQAHEEAQQQQGNRYNRLQDQQTSGGGYGQNRFFQNGEIYNYDPATGLYRGSMSGNVLNQQSTQPYVDPNPVANPGRYNTYMANDPYYQILQDPNNPNNPNYDVRPPKPTKGEYGHKKWEWNGSRWVLTTDDTTVGSDGPGAHTGGPGNRGGHGPGGPTGGGGSGKDGR